MEDVTFPFNHNTFNSILGGLITKTFHFILKTKCVFKGFFLSTSYPSQEACCYPKVLHLLYCGLYVDAASGHKPQERKYLVGNMVCHVMHFIHNW